MVASRRATSRWRSSGSELSTIDAASGCRCASTSAIVCGCSSGQVGEHLARVGLAQELERHADERRTEVLEDLLGLLGAEALLEQLPGAVHTATGHVRASLQPVAELADHLVDRLRLHGVEARDLGHDLLHLGLAHGAQHHRRAVLAELHEEHGRLLRAAEVGLHALPPPVREPGAQRRRDLLGLTVDELGDLVLDARAHRSSPPRERGRTAAARRRRRASGYVVCPAMAAATSGSSGAPRLASSARRSIGTRTAGRFAARFIERHAMRRTKPTSSAAMPVFA